jgi:hypothetical protein
VKGILRLGTFVCFATNRAWRGGGAFQGPLSICLMENARFHFHMINDFGDDLLHIPSFPLVIHMPNQFIIIIILIKRHAPACYSQQSFLAI